MLLTRKWFATTAHGQCIVQVTASLTSRIFQPIYVHTLSTGSPISAQITGLPCTIHGMTSSTQHKAEVDKVKLI